MIGRLIDAFDKSAVPRQHDHRLLGRPRLAPRREAALAEVRPLGRGHPRAAHLGRPRRDEAERRLRPHGRLHDDLPDAHRPLRHPDAEARRGARASERCSANPKAAWDQPAVTTYRFKNHAVRTEGWRYIRYANGDEELYDETKDPNEWTNLAALPDYAARKAELAKHLPTRDHADIGGNQKDPATKKAARQKKAALRKAAP